MPTYTCAIPEGAHGRPEEQNCQGDHADSCGGDRRARLLPQILFDEIKAGNQFMGGASLKHFEPRLLRQPRFPQRVDEFCENVGPQHRNPVIKARNARIGIEAERALHVLLRFAPAPRRRIGRSCNSNRRPYKCGSSRHAFSANGHARSGLPARK